MANLIPKKDPASHRPPLLHPSRTTLISSMLDSFDGLALATNDNGRIVYANRAAEQVTGYHQSEIVKLSLENLFDLTKQQRTSIAQCLAGKGPASFETTIRAKEGASFPVQLKAALLNPDDAERGLAVFGLKHTIEEQARSETATPPALAALAGP